MLLPQTSDVNKQITYAEYIAVRSKKDKNWENELRADPENIYNAFILPFNFDTYSEDPDDNRSEKVRCQYVGAAKCEWIDYADDYNKNKPYKKVLVILMDTRTLMESFMKDDDKSDLAKFIVDCEKFA